MIEDVKILHYSNNRYINAQIIPLSEKHIEEIELTWKPELKNNNCWDKDLEFSKYFQQQGDLQFYVLEYNFVTQGIIALYPNYASRLELGKNLVYVSLLTVAPWNRPDIKNPPDYKGVGTTLISYAVTRSIDLGLEGRIGLHSVKKAEEFYEKMQFINLGCDQDYKNLKYLELSENDAELLVLNYLLLSHLNN